MKFCRFYSFDSIVQCKCGYIVRYDIESTLYLKCPLCGEVLIDRDVEDKHLVPKKVGKIFKMLLTTIRKESIMTHCQMETIVPRRLI